MFLSNTEENIKQLTFIPGLDSIAQSQRGKQRDAEHQI